MIKTNQLSKNIMLTDNLLDESYFEEVSTYAQNLNYAPLEGAEKFNLWQIDNKPAYPLCNKQVYVWTDDVLGRSRVEGFPNISVFPTRSIIDKLIEKVHEVAKSSGFVGEADKEWVGTTSRFNSYGQGSTAKWHRDRLAYTGAFIFYLNKSWHHDWGGHFMCKDEDTKDGQFYSPEPNRLILLKTPYLHAVSPITCPLDTARFSFTGFFLKPEAVSEFIESFKKNIV